MARSTIGSKFRTAVSRFLRERLRLASRDALRGEVDDRLAFLDRRGGIAVGAGSAVGDVARARGSRGLEGA